MGPTHSQSVNAKLHICSQFQFAMRHVDNIIFDLGGVIINLDIPATTKALKQLAEKYQTTSFKLQPDHHIFKAFELGLVSTAEFRDTLRSFIHPEVTDAEIDLAWNAMLLDIPRERLDLLQQLKNQHKTFLLSNTNEIHYKAFHKILYDTHHYPSLDEFFHKAYYSHLIQKRKPDAEAFQLILDENGLRAERTLFLDDTPQHLEGAQRLGMQTMLVTPDNHIHNIFVHFLNHY
jgi:HAD superfamily hydrolase (TIGR01509 family)